MAEEKKESGPKVSSDGRQFTHLYNSPAPWTGMPGGTEFKSYLLKMRDSGKKKELNESEKSVLKIWRNTLVRIQKKKNLKQHLTKV